MTINIRDKKYELIERIMQIDDANILDQIQQELDKINKESVHSTPDIQQALRPIRSSVTLEDIKREQSYVPFSYDEFMNLANEVGMEEPIEELLEMLTK